MNKFESEQREEDKRSHENLSDQVHQQQVDFGILVSNVKPMIEKGASPEIIRSTVEDSHLTEKQKEVFMSAVEKKSRRRDLTAKIKEVYSGDEAEKTPADLFMQMFGTDRIFGEVSIHRENSNLVFVCTDKIDIAQAMAPEEGVASQLEGIPDDQLGEVRDSMAGMPMGMFKQETASLEGIGELDSYIVVDAGEAKSRDIDLDLIVKHEIEHSDNTLYDRKAFEKLGRIKDSIEGLASSAELWIELIKKIDNIEDGDIDMKLEDNEISRGVFEKIIEDFEKQLEKIMQINADSVVDAVVKEELIAFFFSEQSNEDIKDIFSEYIRANGSVAVSAFKVLQSLLSQYASKELMSTLDIDSERLNISLKFGTMLEDLTGKLKIQDGNDDRINKMKEKFQSINDEVAQRCESSLESGLQLLTGLKEKYGLVGEDMDIIKPVLISLPIDRWDNFINKYKSSSNDGEK